VSISYYPYKYLYKLEELNMADASTSGKQAQLQQSYPATVDMRVVVHPPDLGLSSQHSNYMMFKTWTMKGGVGSSTSDMTFEGPHGPFICLPIPSGVGATYEQGWEQEEQGWMQSLAGQGVAVATGAKGAKQASADISASGSSATSSFGAVVGTLGKLVGLDNANAQRSGTASFSNTYVTYSGPGFRDFNFTFSLKPLDRKESANIKNIVDFFKINSSPIQQVGQINRIYSMPRFFTMSYHSKTGPMEHLNKIGKCALTSLGVVYGGDRFAVFHEDSAPVRVDLSLTFKEVQLLSQADMIDGY
jgi:hypothetical protein